MGLSHIGKKLKKYGEDIEKSITSSLSRGNQEKVFDPIASRILQDQSQIDNPEGSGDGKLTSTASDEIQLLNQIKSRIDRAQSIGMDPEACLERITFREPVSQSEVLDCLRTFGLAIFPSIFDSTRLEKISLEYKDLIDNGADLASDMAAREDSPAHSYGISLQRNALKASRFPETVALFGSRTVEEIAKKYFAGQSFDYNGDLFVQWTDHTDTPASGALHWDKQLTLKSWLYVTDATEGFGAMRAGVGTAAWTRYIREDAMFNGIPYKEIVNQIEEDRIPVVPTGGPAGTFFLFVTDTAHGATPVDPGKRRNIIRGRSRPHRVKQWSAWAHKL